MKIEMGRKPGTHDLFAAIPEELWQQLQHDAETNERSVTKQLVVILREHFKRQSVPVPAKKPTKRPKEK